MTAVSGIGTSAYQQCGSADSDFYCHIEVVVGSTWMEVREDKAVVIDPASFDSLARQMLTAMGYHS